VRFPSESDPFYFITVDFLQAPGLVPYGITAMYFSGVMVRLMLVLGTAKL
jgi:hypothetical protein